MSRVRTALWWSRAPAAASGGGASARVAPRTSAAMNGNSARGVCAGIVVPTRAEVRAALDAAEAEDKPHVDTLFADVYDELTPVSRSPCPQ